MSKTRPVNRADGPSRPILKRLSWYGQHLLFIVLLLVLWDLLTRFRVLDPYWFSTPVDTATSLYKLITDPGFWGHVGATLIEILLGFAIGTLAGLIVALLLGESRKLSEFLTPYLAAGYGIPKSALAPLFIVWFGLGLSSKVAMAAAGVFFIQFFNTAAGLKAVDKEYLNLARIANASRIQTILHVKFPAAFPYIITGVRLGLPLSLVLVIVGEFISSSKGLGFVILQASNFFQMSTVFAAILVLVVLVAIMNAFIAGVERYGLRWRQVD